MMSREDGPINKPAVSEKDPEPRAWKALAHLNTLPASHRLVQKAIEATEHPLCTNKQLQAILSVDLGATAGILRLANSPYFGVGSDIRSLAMAITVIGHTRLRSLLRHLLVSNLFGKLAVESVLAEQVWTRALAAGTACHAIAGKLLEREADDLLMGGLLHNIGELALLSGLPDEYRKFIEISKSMPRADAERQVFGVTADLAGKKLLESWHFPQVFLDATAHWRTPEDSSVDRNSRYFVRVVHLGARLGEGWTSGLDAASILDQLDPGVLQNLNLKPPALEKVYETLGPDIEKLRGLFGPSRPAGE